MVFLVALVQAAVSAAAYQPASLTPTMAQGARGLTVTVHRAYVYPNTASWKAQPGHRLVAIDVSVHDVDDSLDLDDIELVEPGSKVALEAAAEPAFLHPDGRFYAWRDAPPSGVERILLVFEIPVSVTAVHVRYWGNVLTRAPIVFSRTGPAMPPERRQP